MGENYNNRELQTRPLSQATLVAYGNSGCSLTLVRLGTKML